MNLFKFEAMLKEFPFLEACVDIEDHENCDAIEIKRVTKELLNSVPDRSTWVGSLVYITDNQTISFVLGSGEIIRDAVKQSGVHGSNYAYESTYENNGETILEAVYRHDCANTLAYIVSVRSGYNIVNHHSEPDWCATIFKPAKDFSLADAIAEAETKAGAEVSAETAF